MSKEELIRHIVEMDEHMYRVMSPPQPQTWIGVELTMSQLKLLFMLFGRDGQRVGELARGLNVTLPTITSVMDKLVDRGLVRRDDDPDDRRQVICRLTPAGRTLAQRLLESSRGRIAQILSRLSEDELRLIHQAMEVLIRAADDYMAAQPQA